MRLKVMVIIAGISDLQKNEYEIAERRYPQWVMQVA